MRICITKCSESSFWYEDKIGSVYKVKEILKDDYRVDSKGKDCYILKSDCFLIFDENEIIEGTIPNKTVEVTIQAVPMDNENTCSGCMYYQKDVIKFRAYYKDKYIPVISIHNDGTVTLQNGIRGFYSDTYGHIKDTILEQYTTYKDAKGKEIYAGDVLVRESFAPWIVTFRYGCFGITHHYNDTFFPIDSITFFEGREVKGNIHQNKDILIGE